MKDQMDTLMRQLVTLPMTGRHIIAIAGAPGSGKSTIADHLAAALNAQHPGRAAVLPMDGYHFDDAVLKDLGLLPRKGSVDTFDAHGFLHMLQRLKANADDTIAVPVFDRTLEIARAGARLIGRDTGILIAEGNYLLLSRDPWSRMRPFFDVTVSIEVDEQTLRRRLTERWQGFGLAAADMLHKIEGNDLPNGRLVATESVKADYRILT